MRFYINTLLMFSIIIGTQLNAGLFKKIGKGIVVYKAVKTINKVRKSSKFKKITRTAYERYKRKKQSAIKHTKNAKIDSKIKQNIYKKQNQSKYNLSHNSNKNILGNKQKNIVGNKINKRTVTKEEYKQFQRTEKIIKQRKYAVDGFWKNEKNKILSGQKTSRRWNVKQKKDIISGKTPKFNGKPIEGHHMRNVKDFPQQADDVRNIYPTTKNEHINRWHGGSFKNKTSGKPLNKNTKEEF